MILFWKFLSDNQPDSSYDPTSCNVSPLVFSSFKDQHCFANIDTPAQPSVRRSLRKCIDFWRSLEVSQFILNVIIQGYNIPFFFHLPTPPKLTMSLHVTTVLLCLKLLMTYSSAVRVNKD